MSFEVYRYRVAYSHTMPHLYMSFSAKTPIISRSFAKNDLQIKTSCGFSRPCTGCDERLAWLQRTATHCNTLQHTATYCNTLQHTQNIATFYDMGYDKRLAWLQRTATHCNTLQHTATYCNILQHTATNYHILPQTSFPCAFKSLESALWVNYWNSHCIMHIYVILYACACVCVSYNAVHACACI